jgi:uncharacterized glyoxalase superfamily protein PhnB
MSIDSSRFLAITPYLHYENVAVMIDWLTRVFGFKERGRWLDGQGLLSNAKVVVGSTEVWLDSDPDYWKQKGRRPDEWIGVWVDDVDAMFAWVKAAGVAVEQPENKFYRIRIFQVIDPEGYTWGFMQRSAYLARFEK